MAAEEALAKIAASANRGENQSVLKNLTRIGKNIFPVDGSNRVDLRKWIEGVNHAKTWTNATDSVIVEFIGGIIHGSLAEHVREFVFVNKKGEATWDEVKHEITKAFLGEEEPQFLRELVARNHQVGSETVREYGRRYVSDVNKAYSQQERAVPLIQENLINTFIRGINHDAIRVQVFQAKPATLDAAVESATTYAHALEQALGQAGGFKQRGFTPRQEEPMDQSALEQKDKKKHKDDEVANLKAQVSALQKKLNVLKVNGNGLPPQNKRRQNQQTCFKCNRVGHIARACTWRPVSGFPKPNYPGLNPNARPYVPNKPSNQQNKPNLRPKHQRGYEERINALEEVIQAMVPNQEN